MPAGLLGSDSPVDSNPLIPQRGGGGREGMMDRSRGFRIL